MTSIFVLYMSWSLLSPDNDGISLGDNSIGAVGTYWPVLDTPATCSSGGVSTVRSLYDLSHQGIRIDGIATSEILNDGDKTLALYKSRRVIA